jgi:hypothetical protein
MALVVIAVLFALYPLRADLIRFFGVSPILNGAVLAVLVFGLGYALWQVLALKRETGWVAAFRSGGTVPDTAPRLLGPTARILKEREGQRQRLTASLLRSLIDHVGLRLDERRDIGRYLVMLLVFLGLFGTFWGMMRSVDAVVEVVGGMVVGAGDDFAATFARFKAGLIATLKGSSSAFSAALFGLGGALVLGALGVLAQHAQNRFHREIEDWLNGLTKIQLSAGEADGDSIESISRYLESLLENTASSLGDLHKLLGKNEEERNQSTLALRAAAEKVSKLVEQMTAQQELMKRLGDAQIELRPILGRLTDEQAFGRQELVTALRTEFRNLGNRIAEAQLQARPYLEQLVKETSQSHQDLVRQLRADTDTSRRVAGGRGDD